jgi:alkyldihydroxyacetonephosphate synthase
MFDLGIMIDSLEPSVTWSKFWTLVNSIKETWYSETRKRNLMQILFFRVSQIYENGVTVYFYYGIGPTKDRDQFEVYEELTGILQKTIKEAGGSVSHHHGIGKKNMKLYPGAISEVGMELMKSIKSQIDPKNVFDAGNLINYSNSNNNSKL